MKYRPSKDFVSLMTMLLILCATGAWVWHQANSTPMNYRANYQCGRPIQPQAKIRNLVKDLQAKLISEFPDLKITPNPVPVEVNGFLLLHNLSAPPHNKNLPLSDALREALDEKTPWNPTKAKQALDKQSVFIRKVENIAALTKRSSSNMPENFDGFIAANTGKTCADILTLKARLAAERGDEAETLRLVAAIRNLAAHYHAIESPSLVCETIATLIERRIAKAACQTLLPAIGSKADIHRWQLALNTQPTNGAGLARVIRGEWHTTSEFMLFPVLFTSQIPDREQVARAYAKLYQTMVQKVEALRPEELPGIVYPPQNEHTELSHQGQQVLANFWVNLNAWTKAYTRIDSQQAQIQAALELLALEKSGTTLTTDSPIRIITREPISGKAFLFNPTTREVTTPTTPEECDTPTKLPW